MLALRHDQLDGAYLGRDQFAIPLKCQCGQIGTAIWEESNAVAPAGPQTYLVSLSGGFYERIRKEDGSAIELVCSRCGTAQAE